MTGTTTSPEEFRKACHGIVPVEYHDWITAKRGELDSSVLRLIAFTAMYGSEPSYCEDLLRAWNSDMHLKAFLESLTAHEQAALLLRLEGAST
jgi:hypothetical protein